MAYNELTWCHCIQSKINNEQFFLYKKNDDDKIPSGTAGVFEATGGKTAKQLADEAASAYDSKGLPLFPKINDSNITQPVEFWSSSDGSNYTKIDIENYSSIISSSDKTAVPTFDVNGSGVTPEAIEAAKQKKIAIQNIYRITDKLVLTRPLTILPYSKEEYTLLLMNINYAFRIDLPITEGTYIYNKESKSWEKQAVT